MPKKTKANAPKRRPTSVRRMIARALELQKTKLEREFETRLRDARAAASRLAIGNVTQWFERHKSELALYVMRSPITFVVSLKFCDGGTPSASRVLIELGSAPVEPTPETCAFIWVPGQQGLESVGRDAQVLRETQREQLICAAIEVFYRHVVMQTPPEPPQVQPLVRGSNGALGMKAPPVRTELPTEEPAQ